MLIRLASPADGPRLAAIYRPAVIDHATSFELEPPDGAEMGRRVMALSRRTPWLAAEESGNLLGYAYASPHRDRPAYAWSVEVSAYVDHSAHRLGVGRALYRSLIAILRLQGFQSGYAGITLPNPALYDRAAAGGRSGAGERHWVSGTLSAGGAGAPPLPN